MRDAIWSEKMLEEKEKSLFQNHLLPAGMMKLIGAKKELESRVLKRNKNRHTKTIYVESTTHIRQKKKIYNLWFGKKKKLGVYFLQFCV